MTKLNETTAGLLLILLAVAGAGWGNSLVAQTPGRIIRDCDVCPEMVVVPPGSFMMGSPDGVGHSDERPQHRVTIDYAFAVGVYEVTFEEWDACVRGGGCDGYEPDDYGYGRGRHPVINVSWDSAWRYADWLTAQTGEEYRLLSEAEWEYVSRAGTETARHWGESKDSQCRFVNGYPHFAPCPDGYEETAPVGSYAPNAFGLYDVLGNVWEWTEDCWNGSYAGAPADGSPWTSGDCEVRVLRGGSWSSRSLQLRSANRSAERAGNRVYRVGFRVARTPQEARRPRDSPICIHVRRSEK